MKDQYYEDMITLTGYPEFQALAEELKKEIYQMQANTLQNSKSWDEVCFTKGMAAGLAAIINLRRSTQLAQKNVEEQKVLDAQDDGDANI